MKWLKYIWMFSLCFILVACGNSLTQPSLESDLEDAVLKLEKSKGGGQGNGILRMNYVTRFSWDQLFIFGPGTSLDKMEQALGFEWPDGEALAADLKEGEDLLVFVKEDKVVRYVHFKGTQGDFAEWPKSLSPSHAVFQGVSEKGSMVIRPVSSFE
ncbi:hypothetical protein [Melghirimyces algeriensis]|uniref:Lipoprotein n=1 Tax=Melghirimyces algeriensis TaxID=910412 RepID=A0A521CM00_9BACL|nr:hypothetical protein [Melghirimyces algeriensis]SMO60468.1 hypothetical protein SAMN06264849_10474 [Melghirimyces algeriensis]